MSEWVGINEMCTGIVTFKVIKSLKGQEAENVWSSIKTDKSQRDMLIKINFREQIHTLDSISTFHVTPGQRNCLVIAEFGPGEEMLTPGH